MTTDTAARVYGPDQPGTGDAVLYTLAANTQLVIRNIHVCNVTGSSATISIAINGTAATAANCWLYQFSIPALSTYDWSGFLDLEQTDTLHALQGTASALTVTVSGVLISNA